jgi:hypothetical protein
MAGARQYGSPIDPSREVKNQGTTQYGQKLQGTAEPKPKDEDPSPNRRVVDAFHKHSDVNERKESLHHTLGPGPGEASPGEHVHDGGTSKVILEGFTLTGSKSAPITMWPSIIACLTRLGAEDNTTA